MAEAESYRRDEVYGVTRELPLNYVTREEVDGHFISNLSSDRHIVVFGSSKQGKTSLRKYTLQPDDYVVVTCSNKWTSVGPLHSAILKIVGYRVEQSSARTAEGNFKITAKAGAKGGIPFVAEANAEGEGSYEKKAAETVTDAPLELDPHDVNDIIGALQQIGFEKYIVLEDFHYLPDETQRDFAVALKAFHEGSKLTFIVVGVWLDENRLIQHNGDLTERVLAVNADAWSSDQLRHVIAEGERLLNIQFEEAFKEGLIQNCFEAVSVVQGACHDACEAAGVHSTQEEIRTVGEGLDPVEIIRGVVDQQSARYNSFLQKFAQGFQETSLQMYRWLLLPILIATPEELEEGLTYAHIRRTIDANHPTGAVNAGNITQALKSTASLQVQHGITPIILDYDQSTRRLQVVDRGFLIWLGHQDRGALLAEAEVPDPRDSQPTLLEAAQRPQQNVD